eukprot:TCALIF_06756-PA protein Name:"Similar to Fzd5 Frizzled-5 (Rattus norvegicus)" AED:0.09 eAED:0.09 QI:0/0/0/0.6/0.75/0.8/5/0/502
MQKPQGQRKEVTKMKIVPSFLILCWVLGWVKCQFRESGKCQPIRVPMCRGMQYMMTSLPNHFNHHTQAEIMLEISQFKPLIHVNCSTELQFFLCSLYTPICIPNYERKIPACRSVCERVKSSCFPIMSQYGFQWPERMACELLPRISTDNQLCMDPLMNGKRSVLQDDIKTMLEPFESNFEEDPRWEKLDEWDLETTDMEEILSKTTYFSSIVLVIGMLNLVSSSIAIVIFTTQWSKHSYPERPLLFMSFCNASIALGTIVKVLVIEDEPSSCSQMSVERVFCSIIHLLIYYFQMGACCWWVIMAVTWFLSVKLMWASEVIEKYGKLFHSLSWIWPLLETALYYATFTLEGNEFRSLCCHGPQDSPTMVLVSIVPLLLKIIFGTVFLSIGIAAGFRVKKLLPAEHIQSLQRIMLKILVFSLIYTLCQLIVILFSLHGILNLSDGLSNWASVVILIPGSISLGWVVSRSSSGIQNHAEPVYSRLSFSERNHLGVVLGGAYLLA